MKQILTVLGFLCLVGCASQEKLTIPSGKWVEVNQKTYIPVGVKKYVKTENGEYNEVF